jgi:hypothetical protein
LVSPRQKTVSIVFRAELIARFQNENPARVRTGGVWRILRMNVLVGLRAPLAFYSRLLVAADEVIE